MNILYKIFGDPNEKFIKSLDPIVKKINSLESTMQSLSASQFREKTLEFKERLKKGETLNDILPEAFALVREASKRTLNQRHFDVQLIGGIVLHQGKVAQMRTGEGKTLSATLPAYLNSLEGNSVHIVTVNEYLAKRDMVWMGQIYDALGLKVGCITNQAGFVYDSTKSNDSEDKERDVKGNFKVIEDYLKPSSKREAYSADIIYGTNHEFGFDYLRDNMIYDLSQQTQRDHAFVIIDEVDSILIDEARVPLIISGQAEDASEKYRQFTHVVANLKNEQDYKLDEKLKSVTFTEEGQNKVIKTLGQDPWSQNDIATTHQLESALKAKIVFLRDRDYVVKGGEVLIIDEFTGRILAGRRWSAGLHQAIEAKEGVKIQPESTTLATITFQNFFRLYKKISGMTGTALTSAEELDKVYKLEVVVIPTHKPILRKDYSDKIFKTEQGKFKAIIKKIKELNEKGQPILVGTRSVERNEYLSRLLQSQGIVHEVLNAKNHEREGQIIAQAGKQGAVTIATNMAGRGVDIILGGNPADETQAQKVRELGGLFVLGTERHDARRIDDQLRGRAGRQGDPGASEFFVSLEDDLMRIFGADKMKSVMTALNVPEDEPIGAKIISGALESAQGKIEGFNFDARHHVLEYDDVMNKHREIIYKKRQAFLENPKSEILNSKQFQEPDNQKKLIEREKQVSEESFVKIIRYVALKVIDNFWQEHLSNMEHMKDSVRLRGYGGKDPLVEYKNEGRKMFVSLLNEIDENIANNVLNPNVHLHDHAPSYKVSDLNKDVGRNDECPCGSGKKYKKCGLINTVEHQKNKEKLHKNG